MASSRDAKIERIKLAMQLLASRGFFTLEDLGLKSVSVFEWYCYQAGGAAVKGIGFFACVSKALLKV